jgi:hypothetical protein
MAVNANKTKFIVFRTRGKPINPLDCILHFNENKIGMPKKPNLIHEIERIPYITGRNHRDLDSDTLQNCWPIPEKAKAVQTENVLLLLF